ncbi:MAG: hypothetical protein A4S09_01100 [Proteobacteria bacterium SG_bin7]|nr:MAG: hypothetical protein A4S09_01100 [Proteobacteria bacterium SG_bin7]
MTSDFLKKQLEESRFQHTLDYVHEHAGGIKKLGVPELLHLNQMLNHTTEDTWRTQPVEISLRTGKKRSFKMITNSIEEARTVLANAHDIVGQGKLIDAATYLYSHLVMSHFFKEANRRTAVVATYWLVREAGKDLDARVLVNTPLGDLSEDSELKKLRETITSMV